MAGGYHLFANGELLTAQKVNDYLMGQAIARVSTSERDDIPTPEEGMVIFNTTTRLLEQYLTTGVTDDWYPVAGRMPQYKASLACASVANNNTSVKADFTEVSDPLALFATASQSVTLPPIAGRYRVGLEVTWGGGSTGGVRGVFAQLDSNAAIPAGAFILDQRAAARESHFTGSRVITVAGSNVIRVGLYQDSGGALTGITGALEIEYVGP